jgi:hypothetical protein
MRTVREGRAAISSSLSGPKFALQQREFDLRLLVVLEKLLDDPGGRRASPKL